MGKDEVVKIVNNAKNVFPDWKKNRANGDEASLTGAIRQEVRAIDPQQPVDDVRTMAAVVACLCVFDRATGDEMLKGHHGSVRTARQRSRIHVFPRDIASQPGLVKTVEVAILVAQPVAKTCNGMFAIADETLGADVPAQFVPHIPAGQIGRRAVALGHSSEKLLHSFPNTWMIETTAGGDTQVAVHASCGDDLMTEVVALSVKWY